MQATSDIRCEMRERERGPCGRPHRIWGIATGEIALCAFARGLEKRQRWAEQSRVRTPRPRRRRIRQPPPVRTIVRGFLVTTTVRALHTLRGTYTGFYEPRTQSVMVSHLAFELPVPLHTRSGMGGQAGWEEGEEGLYRYAHGPR